MRDLTRRFWSLAAAASTFAISLSTLVMSLTNVAHPQPIASGAMEARASNGSVEGTSFSGPATVTLITGDRVRLLPTPTGQPEVILEAGKRTAFAVRREGERIEVIPHEVLDLVPDVLDPDLFDVAGLVTMGFDDEHADSLPLIAHLAPGGRALRAGPGLSRVDALPSIRSQSLRLDKDRAGLFGAELALLAARPGPISAAAAADALGGIDRIWLDATVEAPDAPVIETAAAQSTVAAAEVDPYLTQIGAPRAWATGLDGAGVTVAVLDSGIDSGHPALVGRVRTAEDFTGSGTSEDRFGHGTHVASLVAGTGTGANGARQGIAPAAELLSGKVLGDEGEGRLSWAIAGMEWAVANGADIVSLSLAARPSSTDDPLVQSLDRLARETGTLFVVAAGNSGWLGWAPETVTSPGTAASALSVGAVDEADSVLGFSGQGPTLGSYRAKPDVAAPGFFLLGARAGARVGDLYTLMDGTSVATPLVAGAAALVIQKHPGWNWEQVKSSVTTSAEHIGPSWATGAGRLSLERMVEVETTAIPSTLSPGPLLHPSEKPVTIPVRVTNTGDEERTYSVADAVVAPPGGTPAPELAVVVTPETMTIPPGGTATVGVAFDPGLVDDGYWHGHVDLTAEGEVGLRLPFATYDEPERYQLDLTVLDRNGDPDGGGLVPLVNVDNGSRYTARLDESGRGRLRVAPGVYSAVTVVATDEDGGSTTTVAGTPAFDVTNDASLTIDAREGVQVRPPTITGRDTHATEFSMAWNAEAPNGSGYGDLIAPPIEDVLAGRVFVTPSVEGVDRTFESASRWRLEPPQRGEADAPDAYDLMDVDDALTDPTAATLTQQEVARLAQVTRRFYAPQRDAALFQGLVSAGPMTPAIVHWRELDAPRTETVLMTAEPDVRWGYDSYWLDEGPQRLYSEALTPYEPAAEVVHHFHRAPHVGVLAGYHFDGGLFVEQGLTDGESSGPIPFDRVISASTALYSDGELIGSSPDIFGWFAVPAERKSYRLLGDVVLTGNRHARTVWRFTSGASTDPDVAAVVPPLLTVNYGPSVGLFDTAPHRRRLSFALRLGHVLGADARHRIEAAWLQWSADGGTTWHDASMRRTGPTTFTAGVEPLWLRDARAVSVRLDAEDAHGNTIHQTVHDLVRLD